MLIMKYETIKATGGIIPVPESLSDRLCILNSDYYRIKGRVVQGGTLRLLSKFYWYALYEPRFAFLFWFRLFSGAKRNVFYQFGKLMLRRQSLRLGIEIPLATKIGYGFFFAHRSAVIIHPSAVIGNNCNISQYTTIGSNMGKAATIGDNVYIGPSVCIIENVVVGSNATIGAGSVVVKDVPAGATIAGVPAKVISDKAPGRFIQNKWNIGS